MPDEATKILLVDDQILYRDGLKGLMGFWPEFTVVGEVSNGLEAVEFCRGLNRPDLVLMDIQMPIMNGVEATGIICAEHPGITVVMLTVSAEDEHLFGALAKGAKGYILKDTPSRQLRNRLHGVVSGQGALSGLVAGKVIARLKEQSVDATQAAGSCEPFSERESQIIRLLAQGFSNEEIGAQLYLSSATVKKHISAMLLRCNLENRVQLAIYAAQHNLL